ncbi:MAG: dihydropteroate synthase [Flavobacteriales bacterium]
MRITWNLRGTLRQWDGPMVMGILNATPDSFHAGSRFGADAVVDQAGRMLEEGAAMLDVGGMSTRPGSAEVSPTEEMDRLLPILQAIHSAFPDATLSVDSYRAEVVRQAVQAGASVVNDISAGALDPDMLATVAALKVPYIMMHMKGTPATMQRAPHYEDVRREVLGHLSSRMQAARSAGIADVAIDPGFGFGKDLHHNYALLAGLTRFTVLDAPVLVGVSRKRMICGPLGITAEDALNGSTVLHTIALMKGASILRVHDVRPAVEAVELVRQLSLASS